MRFTNQTLADIGERAFIERVRSLMTVPAGDIVLAAGDDCCAVRPSRDMLEIATTDTFVDGVHFSPTLMDWETTGRRCMTAATSDIAAMAGLPVYALVSLSLPGEMGADDAVSLARGLIEEAADYGFTVTGGETTATPGPATVTVTVTGRVEPDRMATRAGARIGDGVYVTGTFGGAMAGLAALERGDAEPAAAIERFRRPHARIDAARELAARYDVTAMIDVSDGIAVDLGHICDESGCGADIEWGSVPVMPEVARYLSGIDRNPVSFALSSGEEFELLFTCGDTAPADGECIGGVTVNRIGAISPRESGLLCIRNGRAEPLIPVGYEHFRT